METILSDALQNALNNEIKRCWSPYKVDLNEVTILGNVQNEFTHGVNYVYFETVCSNPKITEGVKRYHMLVFSYGFLTRLYDNTNVIDGDQFPYDLSDVKKTWKGFLKHHLEQINEG